MLGGGQGEREEFSLATEDAEEKSSRESNNENSNKQLNQNKTGVYSRREPILNPKTHHITFQSNCPNTETSPKAFKWPILRCLIRAPQYLEPTNIVQTVAVE